MSVCTVPRTALRRGRLTGGGGEHGTEEDGPREAAQEVDAEFTGEEVVPEARTEDGAGEAPQTLAAKMTVGITFPEDRFERLRRQAEQMQRIAAALTPVAERLVREQEHWRNLISPTAELILRDQRRLEAMMKPVTQEMARHQQALADAIRPELLASLQDVARTRTLLANTLGESIVGFSDHFAEIARAGEALRELTRGVAEATRMAGLPLSRVAEQLRTAEIAERVFNERLLGLEAAETPEEREDLIGGVFAALIDWVGTLPAAAISRFTVRDVLRVLLVVVPYLLWTSDRQADSHSDDRTEEFRLANEAWQERISIQIAELAGAVDALATATDGRAVYEAARARPLRSAPHKHARRVATIPECGVMEEIERRGRWLRVAYLDLDSGAMHTGWVYLRFLRPVDVTDDGAGACADASVPQS